MARDFSREIDRATRIGLVNIGDFSRDPETQKKITFNSYKVTVNLTKGTAYKAIDLYNMALQQIASTGATPYETHTEREASARQFYIGFYRVTLEDVLIAYNNFTMPLMRDWTHCGLKETSTGIKQLASTLEYEDRGLVKYRATEDTATLFYSIPEGYTPY